MLEFSIGMGEIPNEGCPGERGFMDEPMAARINTVPELFPIYSFIFANRFPI